MNKQIFLPIAIILVSIAAGFLLLRPSTQPQITQEQIQDSELRKLDLTIENMFCLGCRASVVNSVMASSGVIQADADPGTDSGWVIYDEKLITKDQIINLPIFDAYPATIISDASYSGSTEFTTEEEQEIPLEIGNKLFQLQNILSEKNITMETFFQDELNDAITDGYWDKANNLLDNYIEIYEQN